MTLAERLARGHYVLAVVALNASVFVPWVAPFYCDAFGLLDTAAYWVGGLPCR